MREFEHIYNEAKEEVLSGGNQSSKSIAILSIEKGMRELLYFLSDESEKEGNKDLSAGEFLEKIEQEITFL